MESTESNNIDIPKEEDYKINEFPSYEEILANSKLPRELFTVEKYREYVISIRDREIKIYNQIVDLNEQLLKLKSGMRAAGPIFVDHYNLALKNVEELYREIYSLYHQPDLFPVQKNWFLMEEKIDEISSKIRDLKFVIANLGVMGGFQAVSIVSSKEEQVGVGQIAQPELGTEYARYDFSPIITEAVFNETVEISGENSSSTLFFGSGMAAISTAIALTKEINPEGSYLFGSHLYFENQNQTNYLKTERNISPVYTFDELEDDDLENMLQGDPQFIFVEPTGNTKDLPSVDIRKIIERQTNHEKRIIIIDNTLCGPNFDIKNVIGDLDDRTIVLLISSLQKLYQDGDDLASSGMITIIAGNEENKNEMRLKLKGMRAMLGTNITPYNLKLIQKEGTGSFVEHSKKIGLNVNSLAQFLNNQKFSILEKVVTSPIDKFGVSRATVFYIHFKESVGTEFIDKVIEKAKERNIQISDGASFGFKKTRFMVIEDNNYVRVCPGIENPREIAVLKEIMQEVLIELSAK